jgi:DNA-binding winged helix-turn-helix (wHTH) protein/tetratricopeptide (TPR) repeat protein
MKRFESFRIDTANQCLWHGEVRADLAPKAFDVLRYLVEHVGRLVTPDQLLEALWPKAYVNPEGIRGYIREIRKVLGDRPSKPVFIETVHKRGYQFIAPVTEERIAAPLGLRSHSEQRIVGRERSLCELDDCLAKALRGQRQIVFVTGEPGIGKTTLVDEFQRRAANSVRSIRIARGQCIEGYGGKEPYFPMLEALSGLCRGSGGESLIQTLAAQAPTWLVQFPALLKPEHREMLQREILGATRERMLREIGEVLETITTDDALLLVFEDLHWGDTSTVDLISAVARRRTGAKLMLVGTYQPVDVILSEHPLNSLKQDLLVHQLCREVALEPLSEAEVAEFLQADSSAAVWTDGLVSLLYQRSEGNPLFMVTALDHMIERGLIAQEKGSWRARVAIRGLDLEVPNSLQQMIEVQIERLSPQEQRVLEAASLQRRTRFAIASSAATVELSPELFESHCETLARRHRVVRSSGSETLADGTVTACYEFVHVFYREVCYRRIAAGRRALLHRRLGEWAEAHFESLNEAAVFLADHFEQGGDWPRAIKYLRLAADTVGRRFEPQQAAEILQRALELVDRLPTAERTASEIEILQKLARIYAAVVDNTHAIETYEKLAARAAQNGLIDVEVHALIDMAYPLSRTSSQRSLEVLRRALLLSAQQEDLLLRARSRASCFALRLLQEWNPEDVEQFRNAYAEILDVQDRRTLAPYFADCGFVNWICSEYREARRCLIESVILFETGDESPYLNAAYVRGRFTLTWTLVFLGEWGEALREVEDTVAMFDKNAIAFWRHGARLHRAWVNLHAMDFAGVLALCRPMLPVIRDAVPQTAPLKCLFMMGSAETALEDYESGLAHLLEAQAIMDRTTVALTWLWRMPLESALTELWLAKGDLARAHRQAERLLRFALGNAEHTWRALAWEVNARIAMAESDLTRARDCVAKALQAMGGFEVPLARWRVHATAAELYHRLKSSDRSKHHMVLSRETIMKLANSLPAAEPLRRTFLSSPLIRKIMLGTLHLSVDACL